MRNRNHSIKCFLIMALLLAPLLGAKAKLEVEEAIFYPNRITVIAKGVELVTEGKNTIGFIPSEIDKKSINVALNCEKASLVGIDLGQPEESDKYKKLKNQIETVNAKLEKIGQDIDFYQGLIKSLSETKFSSKRIYSAVINEYDKLSERLRALQNKRKELILEKEKLKSQLKKLKNKKILYATVEGSDQCEIAVRYTLLNGGWQPLYRLSYHNKETTLSLMAKAIQNTQEDWKKVYISFSSSHPINYLSLPKIQPLFVYIIRNPPIRPLLLKKSSFKERKGIKPPVSVRTETLFYYKLGMPVSLKSGEEKLFPIKKWSWKVEPERISIPSKSLKVFVKAKVPRPKDPLINGVVEILSGNFVIGSSYLLTFKNGKFLEFPLGTDEDIEVERAIVDRKLEEKWNGDIEEFIKYRISIYNNKDKKVSLKVFEPLPVSKDEAVKVKILDELFSIKPTNLDKNGIAYWNLKLAPREKKIIEYGFKLRYPKKARLNVIF